MYREIRGLHEAAYILAFFALASQLLALVRDRVLAHQFGAGMELDLYYTAFRIPDLLFVLFSSALSVYVLIPFVTDRIAKRGTPAARALLSELYTLFILTYIAVAVVIAIAAPWIVSVCFPGFTEDAADTLVMLLRLMLLQPFLLGLSNLFGVITQLSRRFVLYALSPVLYNVGIIIGVVALYPFMGLAGLVLGVVLGAAAHMAVQLPYVRGSELLPGFAWRFHPLDLLAVFRTSVPRAVTLSLHQLVLLVFGGAATIMAVGSVSVFQFAFNLQSVPLGIIGVSYSVAAFPALARMFAEGDRPAFLAHVTVILRHIFFWAIPATVLIIVIRAQLVRVVLGTGAFDWDDTRLVAAALAFFVLSLAFQAVTLLIVRAFYAAGDTRTPLYVTILSSGLAVTFAFVLYVMMTLNERFAGLFESLLRVRGVEGTEVLVLPLAFTLALGIHALLLSGVFMRHFSLPARAVRGAVLRGIVAALAGGTAAYVLLNVLVFGERNDTFLTVFVQGAAAGVFGAAVVLVALRFMRSPELAEIMGAFRKRIFKTSVTAPEPTHQLAE